MQPHYDDGQTRLYCGDNQGVLDALPAASVQTVVTSPPYFGLRVYSGHAAEVGREATVEQYVAHLVAVCRAERRVLRDDGTLWLNLGDTRAAKQLLGVPWRVALALQADGWCLRSDVIWHKPNAMPGSARDRPTSAHEYVFLLTKAARYYYDADAIREPFRTADDPRNRPDYVPKRQRNVGGRGDGYTRAAGAMTWPAGGRNKRSVWSIPARGYPGAHFAVFPPELVTPCVLAGSRAGDTVLDPFCGTATAGLVARRLGRAFVGIDLNPAYCDLAVERLGQRPLPLLLTLHNSH